MEKSSFFNSVNGDRKYKAEDFAEYFATFIGNGVFPNPSTNLQIIANNDMTVTLKKGSAWIKGHIYINTDDLILPIDVADGVLNRIDRIVLRMDTAERAINAAVKKGSFANNPIALELQRDTDAYELALADIYIVKGAISITQSNITDLRLNSDLCGIVHGTVDQADPTAIFNQFQSWYSEKQSQYNADITDWTQQKQSELYIYVNNKQSEYDAWFNNTTNDAETNISDIEAEFQSSFNEWFDSIKEQLGTDLAGNLQIQLNELSSKVDDINTSVANEIDELKMLQSDEIRGTIQTPTFDSKGNITKLEYKDVSNNLIRTDSFTITPALITEVRKLGNGSTLTLKYYFNNDGSYNRTEVV
ncbi:hypothetical protein [Clostridium thailandense]|uniref:hypothetical protein n=1 Tax=Clostridium thailandense TaxID=2794346 RepID=UPI0039891C1B